MHVVKKKLRRNFYEVDLREKKARKVKGKYFTVEFGMEEFSVERYRQAEHRAEG